MTNVWLSIYWAKFADDVGKLPELDQFFMLRLERALASVLEGRVRQIL